MPLATPDTSNPPHASPTLEAHLAEPIAFGDVDRPLFGWFHRAHGAPRDCVVVLCNPYGYDAMITHYSYRHLAEQLARAGFSSLRFDPYGTGDSSGEDCGPDRISEWLASIDAARITAMERSGARAVALFGMRVGGLLAIAAGQRSPVDALIVLGPSPSGRAAVRELRALRMLQPPIRAPGSAEGVASENENFGFLLSEEMRTSLAVIDPLEVRASPAPRVLVLPRDDLSGVEQPLMDHFRACGAHVTASTTAGYSAALRGDPYTRDLPTEAWTEIVAWLSEKYSKTSAESIAPTPCIFEMKLGPVREIACRFDGMFGLLTEPVDATHPRARTGIVLLSIGANHRIGSNRMYVRWARAWAALGFRVLRFDLSGIGDSPARDGAFDKEVYAPRAMKEARRAIDFLREKGCDRVVLGGLCSGAYVSFHAAVEDDRVAGILLVNPPTFHWNPGDSLELRTRRSFQATSFYRQRAFSVETWRRALRGEVHVRAVTMELARRAIVRGRAKANDALVRWKVKREPDDIARGFQAICDRGADALLVYGSDDGGVDVMEEHLGPGARKLQYAPTFHLEILEGTDHTFTPRDAQDRLTARLTEHLVARFGER
jgi:pimeloyl-ACP methyl ester carboxylesterase